MKTVIFISAIMLLFICLVTAAVSTGVIALSIIFGDAILVNTFLYWVGSILLSCYFAAVCKEF